MKVPLQAQGVYDALYKAIASFFLIQASTMAIKLRLVEIKIRYAEKKNVT